MMDLKILKKRPDENDEQYIYRVCELKEENGKEIKMQTTELKSCLLNFLHF